MDDNSIGLVAVTLFRNTLAAMYTYYRVRKLRRRNGWQRSRAERTLRWNRIFPRPPPLAALGILLAAVSLGYMAMMAIIGRPNRKPRKRWRLASFPLAAGLGFLLVALIRRDLKSASQ